MYAEPGAPRDLKMRRRCLEGTSDPLTVAGKVRGQLELTRPGDVFSAECGAVPRHGR